MKKLMTLLTCLLLFNLVGCGADNSPDPTQNAKEEIAFHYNGVEIKMDAEAAPILEQLGKPKTCTEEASCAFEGSDRAYYYGSFYLKTYENAQKEYILSLWFADDSAQTDEKITIGMSKKQVEDVYGENCFNGTNSFSLKSGKTKLTIILKDDYVSSIQYEADILS